MMDPTTPTPDDAIPVAVALPADGSGEPPMAAAVVPAGEPAHPVAVAIDLDADVAPQERPPPPYLDVEWHWGEYVCPVLVRMTPFLLFVLAVSNMESFGFALLPLSIIGYLALLCKSVATDTYRYITHKVDGESLETIVARNREGVPHLVMWGEAYHTETHTRTDRDGKKHTTTKTVVTHRASAPLNITGWEDRSPDLPEEVHNAQIVKVAFGLHWEPADDRSRAALQRFKREFDTFNNRDRKYRGGVRVSLDGFEARVLCLKHDDAMPGWATPPVFWAAALTGTLGFFMMAFDKCCARLSFPFDKRATTTDEALGSGRVC